MKIEYISAKPQAAQWLAVLLVKQYCRPIIIDGMGGGVGRSIAEALVQCEISASYVVQHSGAERFTVFDAVLLGRKPHIKLEPTSNLDLSNQHEVLGIVRELAFSDKKVRSPQKQWYSAFTLSTITFCRE